MDGAAVFAGFEMRFDPGAQLGIDNAIYVVRDFTPDLNTTDLNNHVIHSVWLTKAGPSRIWVLYYSN